jgi:hypothetical protein
MEPHDYLYSASKAFGNFLFVNASDGAGTYAVYRTANTASIETISSNTNKELLKIVDLMGREVKYETNKVLIYIYSDGSTERFFHIE